MNRAAGHVESLGPVGKALLLDDNLMAAGWALISADLTGATSEEEAFDIIRAEIQKEVDKAGGTPIVFRMRLFGSTSLHQKLRTQPAHVKDEVKAAADHCTDTIWLESVKVETSEPPTAHIEQDSPLAALDLKTTLDSLRGSPEVLQEARTALALIKGKLPAMDLPPEVFSNDGIASLIDEARELLLSSGLSSEERNA